VLSRRKVMVARSTIRGKPIAIALAALVALISLTATAQAVFPPIYHPPTTPPTPPPVTTTTSPPVTTTGGGTVVVTDPGCTCTVSTPEPATLLTGLMGLMLAGGYSWRKRRK
jgi:MYXO-CTERM domain-containing protein